MPGYFAFGGVVQIDGDGPVVGCYLPGGDGDRPDSGLDGFSCCHPITVVQTLI